MEENSPGQWEAESSPAKAGIALYAIARQAKGVSVQELTI
jgi:hypothetical protein